MRGDAAVVVAPVRDDGLGQALRRIEPRQRDPIVRHQIEPPVAADVGRDHVVAAAVVEVRVPGGIGVDVEPPRIAEPDAVEGDVREAVAIDVQHRGAQGLGKLWCRGHDVALPRRIVDAHEPVGRLGLAARDDHLRTAIAVEVRQTDAAGTPRGTRQRFCDREVRPTRPL